MAEGIEVISNAMIPTIITMFLIYGIRKKIGVYDCFISGAREGLKTVINICPTLIGLMIGVGVLRASGFLDMLARCIQPAAELVGVPGELIPVTVVRLFSSSAATGLILDIFNTYGPDSTIGLMASVSNACTETIFYTVSVYFLSVRVTETRWTLAGAFAATGAGIAASVFLVRWMFGM